MSEMVLIVYFRALLHVWVVGEGCKERHEQTCSNVILKRCAVTRIPVFDDLREFGVCRVYHELKNKGWAVNYKRVQRLMRFMGLVGLRLKRKNRLYKGKVGWVVDNIIRRDFITSLPLEKGTTDVS